MSNIDKKSKFDYLLMKQEKTFNTSVSGLGLGTKAVGFPIGMIMMWEKGIPEIPSGWALCDGQEYKNSDGSVRIKTPDMRGLFVVGPNSNATRAGQDNSIRSFDVPQGNGQYDVRINDPFYTNPRHTHQVTYPTKNYANGYVFTADISTFDKTQVDFSGQNRSRGGNPIPAIKVRPTNVCLHYIIRIY